MAKIKLEQGDCLTSVAHARGFDPQTIWEHGDNADLRERRHDPNALMPGDVLAIPELEEREEDVATDSSQTFELTVAPPRLRVRLTRHHQARGDEAYALELDDGTRIEAQTDGDGWVDQPIRHSTRKAKLILRDGAEVHNLEIGHLDPHDEATGVQSRLRGLGYYFGAVDGDVGVKTAAALRRFQRAQGLEETGELDDATATALRDAYAAES